jgi:5'-nucleotidase
VERPEVTLRRLRWTALSLCLAAAACASLSTSPAGQSPTTLTIVHFNDLHEMVASAGGGMGGVARVATIVRRERARGEGVLVTLGGDFLSPSALSTARVNGQPLAGRQAVSALNLMGVDWAVYGNHEFDLNEQDFRTRLAEIKFGMVSSNVIDNNGRVFAPALPSTIATVKAGGRTIRLGLVGLTIDFTIKPYVRYTPAVEAARAQLATLAGKTDALIAITHLSLAGDVAVVEALPEIDLILGGHEHENIIARRGRSAATIVKADSNGKSAAVVTMEFPADGGRPSARVQIERLDERVTPDPAMQAEVDRWTSVAFAAFRRDGFSPEAPVVDLPEPLDGRDATVRTRAGNLTDLITAALARDAKNPDVAILNGGSIRVDDILTAGPLTEYDIIRVLPFGGKVLRAEVTGAVLSEILAAGQANVGSGGYLHVRGATTGTGGWMVANTPIDPAKWYSIALPEFMLTGGESRMGFLTRANQGIRNVQEFSDIRQAVIAELKARYGKSAARIRELRWFARAGSTDFTVADMDVVVTQVQQRLLTGTQPPVPAT